MKYQKRAFSAILSMAMTMSLCSCQNNSTDSKLENTAKESSSSYQQENEELTFDTAKWNYDEANQVYWRISVQYASNPQAEEYESMGIYVPAAYMDATLNEDGTTYTCVVNEEGKCNGYTASTAPIIFPVDTPGYSAQAAPTSYNYEAISSYVEAGFVYVIAGMRGRSSLQGTTDTAEDYSGGAPWGVTGLKAAVRYYRFNEDSLPGNTESIFTYGMSGGGAQSALMGATGDSELYYPYLESIGAAMTTVDGEKISDSVAGTMAWCPITSLDYADEAYEWNMGQYFSTDTRDSATFTSALSKDMSEEFAKYINELGLVSEDGTALTLSKSETGRYNSGTYYDYILNEIETSLNNFLSDTTFPYEYTQSKIQVGNTQMSGNGVTSMDGTGELPFGNMPDMANGEKPELGDEKDGFGGGAGIGGPTGESITYETVQDYIDSLNTDSQWIKYDAATNTAKITSIEDFVIHCKNATKPVGAFDNVDSSRGENNLFGNGQNLSSHFDAIQAALLEKNAEIYSKLTNWNEDYIASFKKDLAAVDSLGVSIETRENMYNPMYYLSDYYEGAGTSTVATYWRIRTGINQTDTALTVEENLKLALKSNKDVESVDFATVWGQPHTTAERTGTSTENFIEWVNDCLAK